MLRKYAELIVKQGVNLQAGQDLVVDCSIDNYELARMICDEAYKVGANDVIVRYSDEYITKARYDHCDVSHFEHVPGYIKALKNEYALKKAAFVMITSESPTAFKDVDPLKMAAYSKAMHKECDVYYDHVHGGVDRWCIAGAPSIEWANQVFEDMSDQEALEALWKAIYHVCRVDTDNPIEEWNKHRRSFEERVNILNNASIQSVRLTNSLGTDLTLEMIDNYLFAGGGSYTTDGIYSFPNIPTEEIFVSPHRNKVNGIVYSSMPLNYNGTLVKDFSITFKDGRIVEYSALEGYDVLKSIIETDDGSHYLGELALVPYDSPIRNMNILFYNTLFDENASCHLAIGSGFNECIKNGLNMSKEELFNAGINDSYTHVDFMIGTSDMSIVATLKDGSEMIIFENGNFVF